MPQSSHSLSKEGSVIVVPLVIISLWSPTPSHAPFYLADTNIIIILFPDVACSQVLLMHVTDKVGSAGEG